MNQLNLQDLSALLAVSPSASANLLALNLPGIGGVAAAAPIPMGPLLPGTNDPQVLSSLLLQKHAEEQRLMLAQRLASLGGVSATPFSADNLALLLAQRRHQQQLQELEALRSAAPSDSETPNALALLASASQVAPAPSVSAGYLGGPLQPPNQLESVLAGLYPPQHTTMTGGLDQVALLQEAGSLPLPPDRRRKGRMGTFPQKLHQMLIELELEEGGSDIASFVGNGRAFAIHKPRDFVKQVMPKYFRMSRFSSFQRQLNLYSFERITEGQSKGAYFHAAFQKSRPILTTMMKRTKIKGIKNQLSGKKALVGDGSSQDARIGEDESKHETETDAP